MTRYVGEHGRPASKRLSTLVGDLEGSLVRVHDDATMALRMDVLLGALQRYEDAANVLLGRYCRLGAQARLEVVYGVEPPAPASSTAARPPASTLSLLHALIRTTARDASSHAKHYPLKVVVSTAAVALAAQAHLFRAACRALQQAVTPAAHVEAVIVLAAAAA